MLCMILGKRGMMPFVIFKLKFLSTKIDLACLFLYNCYRRTINGEVGSRHMVQDYSCAAEII